MFNLFKKKTSSSKHTFFIDGMHCVSCSLNIDGALEDIDGVATASTSYAQSKTDVSFDASKTSIPIIKKTIEALGYQVTEK